MSTKKDLQQKFSTDPNKYYKVNLFEQKNFDRKACSNCGTFFWTLDSSREKCPQQTCQLYEFLGNPPTSKKMDYIETWKEIEGFFVKKGHSSIRRYPVVCRWRPDLYFTVASIIDFQRIEGDRVIFDLPANPLIVPQICLRFNDIANVGITGKHNTSLCMIGQHSILNNEGYYKDNCIDLDYELLTSVFAIDPKDIVFVEDVWVGYGAFGFSLEYYVKGLEIGNAVFTEFEGTPDNYNIMKEKVVDMGAGLERFTWMTQGTPTSYESTFGPVLEELKNICKINYEKELLIEYFKLAGTLNIEETHDVVGSKIEIAKKLNMTHKELSSIMEPIESLYAVTDHVRTLVFAISDGGLPSNVGGGYNLRVILRRAATLIKKYGWKVDLEDIANLHVDYLSNIFPELREHKKEIKTILNVEEDRLNNSTNRVNKTIESLLKSKKSLTDNDLVKLYDSDGITPELLKENGAIDSIPQDFYTKVSSTHLSEKSKKEELNNEVLDVPKTKLLYFQDQDCLEFESRILKIIDNKFVVLKESAFYPRSGGQEPDHGKIGLVNVNDVIKSGEVVLHQVDNIKELNEGDLIKGTIDKTRREILKKHHTATHIINASAKKVLGSWVWQHSSFKDIDIARLDITHHAHLEKKEILEIEKMANEIVMNDIPVKKEFFDRADAENKYDFRIYQGGVVPGKEIRIVNILDVDVEACGGTHVNRTGEIGLIKILKSERIQDGVERLEFVAGNIALSLLQNQEKNIEDIAKSLESQRGKVVEAVTNTISQLEDLKKGKKILLKELIELKLEKISSKAIQIKDVELYFNSDYDLDEEYHIELGKSSIMNEPKLIYVGLANKGKMVKVFVFVGKEAISKGIRAGEIVKEASKIVGGSGGGDSRFGQGGGENVKKIKDVKETVLQIINNVISK